MYLGRVCRIPHWFHSYLYATIVETALSVTIIEAEACSSRESLEVRKGNESISKGICGQGGDDAFSFPEGSYNRLLLTYINGSDTSFLDFRPLIAEYHADSSK